MSNPNSKSFGNSSPDKRQDKSLTTESEDYSHYLQKKYLPFRDQYLFHFYFPQLLPHLGKKSGGGDSDR
jgi:hypothetical protein